MDTERCTILSGAGTQFVMIQNEGLIADTVSEILSVLDDLVGGIRRPHRIGRIGTTNLSPCHASSTSSCSDRRRQCGNAVNPVL